MINKISLIISIFNLGVVLSVRIPPNPCPQIFSYYRDTLGQIYGTAVIPYDGATSMDFTVNASMVGRYKKADLKLKMVTGVNELNDYAKNVTYNVFFPFQDVIPKITGIAYNGRSYCSGPAEPVVPGAPGITNVWHKISFKFTRMHQGFYGSEAQPGTSDDILPVRDPGTRPQFTPYPVHPQSPQTQQTLPPWTRPTPAPKPNPVSPNLIDAELDMRNPDLSPVTVTPAPGPEKITPDPTFWEAFFTSPPSLPTFTSPSVTANEEFKCGIAHSEPTKSEIRPFIFNAEEAEKGEFPWLVAVMAKRGSSYSYICSGNLISDKHVLTAAQCVQFYSVQKVETEDILLVMGTNSIANWQSNGAVQRKVSKVLSHPFFIEDSKSAHGDVAVLTMVSAVQFSNVISPVCLWKGNTDLHPLTNRMGVIAGFGQDEESQRRGNLHAVRLKRANMPIVSQTECLTSPLGLQDLLTEKTFCTKSGDTPTGPCIGDTGDGFFIKIDNAYYLRGIASFVPSDNGTCDLSTHYSVFCDVAKFVDWIKKAMT